jgi:non-heme chloroperoxidase
LWHQRRLSCYRTAASAAQKAPIQQHNQEQRPITKITTKHGTQIYYKDWGTGQPLVFHHGWPLSSDDWDAQMLFFVEATG